jgi:hypothetical protein
MLGMNDTPRPDAVAIFPTDLPIRDDRSADVDGDPAIGRQIEGGTAPDLSEKCASIVGSTSSARWSASSTATTGSKSSSVGARNV